MGGGSAGLGQGPSARFTRDCGPQKGKLTVGVGGCVSVNVAVGVAVRVAAGGRGGGAGQSARALHWPVLNHGVRH